MNQKDFLLVKFNNFPEVRKTTQSESPGKFFDFKISRTDDDVERSTNYWQNRESGIFCSLVGYISNFEYLKTKYQISAESDVEFIGKLYLLLGIEKAIDKLDGIYTIFIFNAKQGKAHFFQDRFGSSLYLYYGKSKDGIVFSTSIKPILESLEKIEFNFDAARDFLAARHTIPDEKTLIRGIEKLEKGKYFEYGLNGSRLIKKTVKYSQKKQSLAKARENLLDSIKKRVQLFANRPRNNEICCALSSGYDTNLVLYYLKKFAKGKIAAITIGGKEKNEINLTRKNLENGESKISHQAVLIERNAASNLPDIVQRTEGAVCEGGLFLQYFLAKEAAKNGYSAIFLGEGADQILDPHIEKFSRLKEIIKRTKLGDFIYTKILKKHSGKSEYLKIMAKLEKSRPELRNGQKQLDFILKKSGLMLGSFGIRGLYPFLNKATLEYSKKLGILNTNKRFYKKQVRKLLGKNNFQKIGGSTDIEYLLEPKSKEILAILDSEFIGKIIDDGTLLKEIRKNRHNLSELVLHLVYLYLFNEIFIKDWENTIS